jgi:hypothetical protein
VSGSEFHFTLNRRIELCAGRFASRNICGACRTGGKIFDREAKGAMQGYLLKWWLAVGGCGNPKTEVRGFNGTKTLVLTRSTKRALPSSK